MRDFSKRNLDYIMSQTYEKVSLDGLKPETIDLYKRRNSNIHICNQLNKISELVDALYSHIYEEDKRLAEMISEHYKACCQTRMAVPKKE